MIIPAEINPMTPVTVRAILRFIQSHSVEGTFVEFMEVALEPQ